VSKRLKSKHLYDLAFVSDPHLSPDGAAAAAVVTRIDRNGDGPPRYRSRIRLYDLDGDSGRDFTLGRYNDTAPRFDPTGGRLAYLSVRRDGGRPQLTLISLDGGEGQPLTDHASGVSAFAWHPSGQKIAYLTRGDWHDEIGERGGARTVRSRRYKLDGVGFLPTGAVELRERDIHGGAERTLESFDLPPTELRYGADGHLFVFAPDPDDDDALVAAGNVQLWRYSAKGKRRKRLLEHSDMLSGLSPSPDGESVAYQAPTVARDFTSPSGVWIVATAGGRASLLSGDFETQPSVGGDSRFGSYGNPPAWSASGGSLLVNINVEGRSGLVRIRRDGARTRLQEGDRAVTAFDAVAGSAVFTAETPNEPGELWIRYRNGRERRLSGENAVWRARFALGDIEGPFPVDAESDDAAAYWSLAPKRARKDGARVVQVHGGPHTNYGYGFYFEFHLLASAGYRVVFGNPRGSSSFGTGFAQAMLGAYGSVDADDVLAMCDDAERRYGDAPVHLTGGSYGGFMTNWLVGQTDRFASAVTQRSISNWLSFYGSSDIGYRFTAREVGGVPWSDLDLLWQQSPLKYVEQIGTPLLLIHSELDHRCPIEQAEQLFVALRSLGKAPTELVRFPDEGHELSRSGRADRRIERLVAILGWFERFPGNA
jgi:acylaminoacyl-peptidase